MTPNPDGGGNACSITQQAMLHADRVNSVETSFAFVRGVLS